MMLIDSGACDTQIPDSDRMYLRDIQPLPRPVMLETADNLHGPICTEQGILDVLLEPHKEIISFSCLLRPGEGRMWMMNADALEAYSPDGSQTMIQLWRNKVQMGDDLIPIYRLHGSPFLCPAVKSSFRTSTAAHAMAAGRSMPAFQIAADIHRKLGHAHPQCCVRTARKSIGGLKPISLTDFRSPGDSPCMPCAMRMHAPSVGQGNLSTGAPHPTQSGELLSVDAIGPFPNLGLKGEKYVLHVSCAYSGYMLVRTAQTKDQFPSLLEEMLVEMKTKIKLEPTQQLRITLHSDTDSNLVSKKVRAMLLEHDILGHKASPYHPQTNPYAERAGGVLLHMLRAMLIDGRLPPKFWSVLISRCAWTWNRLVRADGYAPIELFEKRPIDFTDIQIPGVLVYWHLHKRLRDDKKLGPLSGVGVYMMPADAVNQSGHMVYSLDGRLISTPFVLPDPTVMPFDIGLRQSLAQHSTQLLSALPEELDPGHMVMDDGVDATTLYGAEVYKKFGKKGWFSGRVIDVRPCPVNPSKIWFKILYEDNDWEQMSYDKLKEILIKRSLTAASFSSSDPAFWSSSSCHGHDFDTAMPAFDIAKSMQDPELLRQAFAAASLLDTVTNTIIHTAGAAKRYKFVTREEMAAGKQYTWSQVRNKLTPQEYERHVAAMNEEIRKLAASNHVRRHTSLPPGVCVKNVFNAVGVFREKTHDMHTEGGSVLKGRMCLDGGRAPTGGWETTANVASHMQILLILALATGDNDMLQQIDVKSAFTQVALEEAKAIWLRPLPGFPDEDGHGLYLELLHYLYGHKEANNAWMRFWVSIVTAYGFRAADRAQTVFYFFKDGARMRMATVVDDSLVSYNSKRRFDDFIATLRLQIPIAVQEVSVLCGLRIIRDMDGGCLSVDQEQYIEDKAKFFGWDKHERRYATPMSATFQHGTPENPVNPATVTELREKNGSLLFATITRPDAKFACSKIAGVTAAPALSDVSALDRVGRYLYDTRKMRLNFSNKPYVAFDGTEYPPNTLIVFVDASFGQSDDRRSQTGIVIMFNGSVIYSKSGKQTQLADSTGYAETIACHEVSHLVLVYRELLANLGCPQTKPTPVYEDNSACIAFANNGSGPKSMHYEIQYLFINEVVKAGHMQVLPVPTAEQLADICTKPCSYKVSRLLLPKIFGMPLTYSRDVYDDSQTRVAWAK
jgi:hypothetical protein